MYACIHRPMIAHMAVAAAAIFKMAVAPPYERVKIDPSDPLVKGSRSLRSATYCGPVSHRGKQNLMLEN